MSIRRNTRNADVSWQRLVAVIEACEGNGQPQLPAEPRLCEQIGITRSRLRGLLQRAEDEGLIWRHVGKGTFAGPRPIVREDALRDLDISVNDLLAARALIEPRMAAQAALHATAQDIAAMQAVLEAMRDADSFPEWRRLDARLHRHIAIATHNPLLVLIYDTLRMPLKLGLDQRIEEVFGRKITPRDDTDREHAAMIEAIAARRADAAEQMMQDHIRSVRDRLFADAPA